MTIFVDASALIAIMANERDADELADVLQAHDHRYCSSVSMWETIAGLNRSYGIPLTAARMRVNAFLAAGEFEIVPIGETEGKLATDAHIKYGKGRHKAALNMGDCFAYACAKLRGAKLLYKGNDFIHTDLA